MDGYDIRRNDFPVEDALLALRVTASSFVQKGVVLLGGQIQGGMNDGFFAVGRIVHGAIIKSLNAPHGEKESRTR